MNKHDPDLNEDKNAKKDTTSPRHLSLPSLMETAELFTQWFTPFLTNEQRAKTRTALNAFVKPDGLGLLLQEKLEGFARRPETKNWLENYWATRFLSRRDPVAVNDNFFFLFRHGEMDRTKRAAALIAAALNYKLVLDQGQMPLAVERTTPTCTNQTKNLFSTTRIPGKEQDRLQNHTDEDGSSSPRHIIVFCRGNIFQLELISDKGLPHSLRDIEKTIEKIVDGSLDEQSTGRSIGHLTTAQRTNWAQTRRALMQSSKTNTTNLELIGSALFSVHLDDHKPQDNLQACDLLLKGNSGNRWFDKSLQFIIFKNGFAGLNVEHSGLDRATIVDFLDYVLGIDPNSIDHYSGAVNQGMAFTKNLTFDLTPTFQKKITQAATNFKKLKDETTTKSFEFTDFDTELLAQTHISPDALAQCALQLAHWRVKNSLACVGQNISTRHYTLGRVVSAWVVTSEMIDFVTVMLDATKDKLKKFEAFKKAAKKHETRSLECRQGVLPEQHLQELLNIYHRNPDEFQTDFISRLTTGGLSSQDIDKALTLFTSPGWTCMHKGAFTTSFLASPTVLHQGFSPVDPGNIAIACLVHTGALHGYLCADKGKKQFLNDLIPAWQQALAELQTLLRETQPLPAIELED